MPEATTSDPIADLENKGGDETKIVTDSHAEAALDDALKAAGFNPDGSPYEPKPEDIQPKGATGPSGSTGPAATGAADTGASGATGPSGDGVDPA